LSKEKKQNAIAFQIILSNPPDLSGGFERIENK
jgi:hypothetical protein